MVGNNVRPRKRVVLLALLAIPVAIVIYTFSSRTPRIVRAAGTTYYASPGDNLQQKINTLQPGDTLLLNDGIYYSPLWVENKSGTAMAQITIKAVNDGKAIIDGSHITSDWTPPVFIGDGAAYIDIEGISARNAPQSTTDDNINEDVILVYGTANNITLKRVTAHDASPGNHHCFDVESGARNVLVEDSAAWGRCRYDFIAYHASYVTFRRDFGYGPSQTNFSPAPRSAFGVYGSSNIVLENDIGINAIPTLYDDDYFSATWHTSDDPAYPDGQTTYLGDIFYNDCQGIAMTGASGDNVPSNSTTYKDVYIDVPSNTACQTDTTKYNSDGNAIGIDWGAHYGGSISNVTITNAPIAGFNTYSGSGHPSLTNSLFLSNAAAITGSSPSHSYLDFYGNSSNGVTLGATDKQANPGYDTATYGRGAYLFIPPSSPLKGTGASGNDIGANIIYEYSDGLLTGAPLWPWPMENRIMSELGVSVTWAANGGIWKTLSNVYPNTTPPPPPAGSPVPGDCNSDNHVTIIDLSILLSHYGQAYSACDFNSDSTVNIFDLSILLSNYGR
jgi:hypothetical protein